MVDDQLVRREAKQIARDADLSDAESECLRDLLAGNEAFAFLVTAQQAASHFDGEHDFDVDVETQHLAVDAGYSLGAAIDRVVDDRREDARAIEELRNSVDAVEGLNAYHLYDAGFESVADLQAATQAELADLKSIGHSRAAKIKTEVSRSETVATDGGADLPTYGTCDCGGTHVLDPASVDGSGSVEFPCEEDDCDWVHCMVQAKFEAAIHKSNDHSLAELRAAAQGGVAA